MDLSDKLTQLAQKRDGIDIQLAAISLHTSFSTAPAEFVLQPPSPALY